ncbi:hypothetical protein HD597_000165 [Nonomuraea thailandensis]|uniref:GRAM domain-containing protein n=1 Tax=Nonomuraea thailandensis TaxID=1188745 RepID=A0A9X2G8H6_9ACTN|nr:GRAM domain-containing protein [Nonomuraea thailandensis]MCP2353145.1 hypothetical protein [Nonomuraea thailandensis]
MDERALAKVFQGTDIVAAPGESVVRRAGASLRSGPMAVRGRLWLTSHWLVFRSHSMNVQAGVWAWPLVEIVSVAPDKTVSVMPTGMEIVLWSDERVHFLVYRRQVWIKAIMEARG